MKNFMRYFYCVVVPLLLQILTVYIIIVLNTGNGSWAGLAALLFAIPIIPVTAIVNIVRTTQKKDLETAKLFLQSILFSIGIPVVIIGGFIIMAILESLI